MSNQLFLKIFINRIMFILLIKLYFSLQYNIVQRFLLFKMRVPLKLFIFIFLIALTSAKLYQVVSLFRHGARYHLNSLYDGNTTHNVWGQLTPVGMRQHQKLGKILNKQYIKNLGFLNQTLDKKQIEMYSTDVNRTIISGLSQLYGIYPPGNGPKLQNAQKKYHLPPFTNQTDIDQQSFAFPYGHQHVMAKFDQNILLQICPNYNSLVQKNLQIHSAEYAEMNLTYYSYFKRMVQIFNLSSNSSLLTLSSLFDTLIVDKFMGRSFPNGFTSDDLDNMQHIHNWLNNVKYSAIVANLANTGKFVKILSQFDNRIKNLKGYPLKWSFLSAHDTDILPAQIGLNFSSFQCIEQMYRKGKTDTLNCQLDVPFASSIIFELHSDNQKDFYVMIRSQGKYMNLCQKKDTKCSYNQFKNRIKNDIVPNVKQVCGIKDSQISQDSLKGYESIDHNNLHLDIKSQQRKILLSQ